MRLYVFVTRPDKSHAFPLAGSFPEDAAMHTQPQNGCSAPPPPKQLPACHSAAFACVPPSILTTHAPAMHAHTTSDLRQTDMPVQRHVQTDSLMSLTMGQSVIQC